jgi:hypothetical protein
MAENVTKKQHFVPKFYLKRFAINNQFVEVLDLDKRKLLKPYPCSGVCYEEFFYAVNTGKPDEVSQNLEKAFKQLEDMIAPKLDAIIESIGSSRKMEDEELYILAIFMSMLWVRGVYMRKQSQRLAVDMAKQSMAILASHQENFPKWMKKIMKEKNESISEKEIEEVRETFMKKDYDLKFNNALHFSMIKDMDKYANLFLAKKWRFYTAGGKSQFITSDTPTIEWFPASKGFYGPDIFQRKHYLALTPKILIELSHPKSPGKMVKREMIYDDRVLGYNMTITNYSDKYCYAKNKGELQVMLDLMGIARERWMKEISSGQRVGN